MFILSVRRIAGISSRRDVHFRRTSAQGSRCPFNSTEDERQYEEARDEAVQGPFHFPLLDSTCIWPVAYTIDGAPFNRILFERKCRARVYSCSKNRILKLALQLMRGPFQPLRPRAV